jgi:hypothetical protein
MREIDTLAEYLQRLFPRKPYSECLAMAEWCIMNYGAEMEKFSNFNFKEQDNIIDCLIAIREYG